MASGTRRPLRTSLTRAQLLADEISERLDAERAQPGDRVGSLEEWRAESGFARSTVSEAVRLLVERGVIEIRPGRNGGLFAAKSDPLVRLRHTLLSVQDDETKLADAIVVRDSLEEVISIDAARHRTRSDVADLKRLMAALRRADSSVQAFLAANFSLHRRIAEITPNSIASSVYSLTLEVVADAPVVGMIDSVEDMASYMEGRVQIHDELVAAIIDKDVARTRRAVHAHHGLTGRPSEPD